MPHLLKPEGFLSLAQMSDPVNEGEKLTLTFPNAKSWKQGWAPERYRISLGHTKIPVASSVKGVLPSL